MVEESNNLDPDQTYETVREEAEKDIRDELGDEPGADALAEPDLDELESLEADVGLKEVELDQAVIDTVATDDTDDNLDANDDGIEDNSDREEIISNLPQALTESYGTGLQGKPTDRAGRYSRRSDQHIYSNGADPILTGGDIDANYEQASVVGDEAVGGTVSTPDKDVVEELAAAVGVEIDDYTDLRINNLLEERDDDRWELDPKSSEDYQERRS